MADFEKAFKKTLGHEGGYSNHKKDKGGETYKGISRVHWGDWYGWIIIDEMKNLEFASGNWIGHLDYNISLNQAVMDFYKEQFWNKLLASQLRQRIANELFDTAVNMGLNYAIKCLQKSLNILNRNEKDYKDLLVDGGFGSKTLSAYKLYFETERFKSRNIKLLENWLLKWINFYQLVKYEKIAKNNKEQEVFIPGWTNRV
ncbi:MAG: hypothetical protein N4A49_01760 [Marinifilaceae bacterium]|jgi:lysozyme family protein|nr:hypothetical protein [Marinifilaceae bacterium]